MVGGDRLPGVSGHRVVALLGRGVVEPDTAVLRATDIGALHADGVFETMHVRRGQAWLLDEHLARMTGSAARLELDLPDLGRLAELVAQALSSWPAQLEGALRLVCAHGGPVFVTIAPVPELSRQVRRDGVTVVTAPLPPLQAGVKSLSYAVNLVHLRRARSLGADDMLWVSSDGHLLEGPTSALVWLTGATLCTVPAEPTGILPATTAVWLRSQASALGWSAESRMITPGQLTQVDGAWLTSSVRGAVAIRSLDGAPLRYDTAVTARVQELLGF
jgi:4-amino-4-deoxychorismate lyase